jgi:hypothetical protein
MKCSRYSLTRTLSKKWRGIEMKTNEKPILFSTPMVREIIYGHKTQTRRVIKPQPTGELFRHLNRPGEPWGDTAEKTGLALCGTQIFAPYMEGDILWVRETWTDTCRMITNALDGKKIHYCADCKDDTTGMFKRCKLKKRPSTHMPREAARLFLRVTDVRAERLQDISEEDAEKEGVTRQSCGSNKTPCGYEVNYRNGFMYFWDETCNKNGTSWEDNPWVFCYSFEPVEVTRRNI